MLIVFTTECDITEVFSFKNKAEEITFAINMTTDSNSIYLVSSGSVPSFWLSTTQHY
jgi:hypothetical protein